MFREYALDGAMLFFDPRTGTNLRVESAATRALRRTAPRVVMFGITNACNLRCTFCSRDAGRESRWTVDSAAVVLEELAAAGVLEVAFGGGEPFAFRGFVELIERLSSTTRLALNVTTNGTLLADVPWARLRGRLGQVRVSIYPDQPWREAAEALASAEQRWGANVLVDAASLDELPVLLAELAARGCRDVSLLSYVGPDPDRHLTAESDARLAAIIAGAPLPARLSVCFGARVGVPRLFDGADGSGDCGAGLDFISIGPDQRVQSCSFQDTSVPIASAADALEVWRARRDELSRPSPRRGCARAALAVLPSSVPPVATVAPPSVRVWQAFSGNNSGECVLVARFDSTYAADRFLAELVPGYTAGEPYSERWKALFRDEQVDTASLDEGVAPDELLVLGASLLVRTHQSAEDDFPELRALAWKRGARVLPGGIHEHDRALLLFAIQAISPADAAGVVARAPAGEMMLAIHGDVAIGAAPLDEVSPPSDRTGLDAVSATVRDLAAARPLAAQLYSGEVDAVELLERVHGLDTPLDAQSRLVVRMWGEAEARVQALAAELSARAVVVGQHVLVDVEGTELGRMAAIAQRAGAQVSALIGRTVAVQATLWPADAGPLDRATLQAELSTFLDARLGADAADVREPVEGFWRTQTEIDVRTADPAAVLAALPEFAAERGLKLHLDVAEADPLDAAIRARVSEARARRPRPVQGRRGPHS